MTSISDYLCRVQSKECEPAAAGPRRAARGLCPRIEEAHFAGWLILLAAFCPWPGSGVGMPALLPASGKHPMQR